MVQMRVLAVLLLAAGPILAQEGALTRSVEVDGLRLRAGPAADQPVRAHLKRGTRVELLQQGSGPEAYCEIDAAGQRGFVACRLLSVPALASASGAAAVSEPAAPYADAAPLLAWAREPWPINLDQALIEARGADMKTVRAQAEADWARTQQRAQTLRQALGLESAHPERLRPWVDLLRELELPPAQTSLWRGEVLALAPASNAQLAARLKREARAPLWLHRWLREGRWQSESVKQPPGCALLRPSEFALLTAQALPTEPRSRVESPRAGLQRVALDLDGDGQDDLLAWILERGPDGVRAVLVSANVDGHWKLLGRVRGSC